jgi:hypothetical protein
MKAILPMLKYPPVKEKSPDFHIFVRPNNVRIHKCEKSSPQYASLYMSCS